MERCVSRGQSRAAAAAAGGGSTTRQNKLYLADGLLNPYSRVADVLPVNGTPS